MDLGKLAFYGAIGVIGIIALMFLFVGLALFNDTSEGESPGTTTRIAQDTFDAGEVTDAIKPSLARLFKKVGEDTNVPAYLLAAVNAQECGRVNSLPDAKLKDLIESNSAFPIRLTTNDLGHMGCAYDNGSNVWGPMQFQYMTFFGYPRGRKGAWSWDGQTSSDTWANSFSNNKTSKYYPANFPDPLPSSNGGLATLLIRTVYPDSAIASRPASIISLKDSVYAAAIYMRALARRQSENSEPWTEEQFKKAACGYYGACSDGSANYWPEVQQKIEKYRGKLESAL